MNDHEFFVRRDHISPSSLATFARCPRRFFFRHGCGLSRPGVATALKFGEAIHHAMPHAQRKDIEAALAAFDEVWDEGLADKKRSRGTAERILRTFISTRSGSIYKLEPPLEMPTTLEKISADEVPFAVDIEVEVPLVGRIDAIGRHRDTEERFGIEYKTTSEFSQRFFEGFVLNPQIACYSLALSLLSPESNFQGVILEALQVALTSCKTMAVPIRISNHLLGLTVDWCQNLWAGMQRGEETGEWPQNIAGCNPYASFGLPGYTCEFIQLCQSEDWTSLVGLFDREPPKEYNKKGILA